jgi:hypothetical protein
MALISDFLDALTSRDGLLPAYEDNPTDTMTGYGLTGDQQELITGGNLGRLRSALEQEVGPKPYIIVHIIVHLTDTGGDVQQSTSKGSGKGGKKKSGGNKGGKRPA